ncbi:HD domain-containing protein [Mesorhizobium sp. M4B.F.Ca.ET.215.01.1.1]|nr:HD domain-containing protein [Mesorhizobium sp. M4B.F.Ca.ET.013.02.1.1]RVD37351.1 HD domain-containing protein [Mesorhizobium sp. M4B.F.Ca.ET.019.03.1.1]RWF60796.1 MAG: HD domain-containing protein [Mesorhizobium sp.]TGQ04266.1 HD domain-containing protein [Mesorhizobium sp. M4B.F.Ca.ET.215.01.1.1]TGQ25597.1 HD domain-containing protein [Mesorhizobium sp. M00.F.Ca.ET.220.01.1.1]TGQ28452.1 HD domain-containing protein [Mesorhizobium sp. M4B.F.Ca.ET.214.01.1.1]TGQ55429.1 HD domain-containing
MSMLYRAARIAEEAHRSQTDKTGEPYIEHSRRVAEQVETLDQKIVAYLHDVVEKGEGWTLGRLRTAGFGSPVVAAVDALTRRLDETEQGFLCRAASNRLALPVKRADLNDNLWQARQAGVSTAKYETGLRVLNRLRGAKTIPPKRRAGTSRIGTRLDAGRSP